MTGSSGDLHWPDLPSDVTAVNPGCFQIEKSRPHMWKVTFNGVPVLKLKYFIPCWPVLAVYKKNMQNCSRITFYEWINHIPKRQFTLTFNILQAFSDHSDKALFQAMPLSQIIVLCFSVTLWRNGTPGLEKQLIMWIVARKWTMTEERDWISIGLRQWLHFYFKMLPVLPRFVPPLSSKHVRSIAQLNVCHVHRCIQTFTWCVCSLLSLE